MMPPVYSVYTVATHPDWPDVLGILFSLRYMMTRFCTAPVAETQNARCRRRNATLYRWHIGNAQSELSTEGNAMKSQSRLSQSKEPIKALIWWFLDTRNGSYNQEWMYIDFFSILKRGQRQKRTPTLKIQKPRKRQNFSTKCNYFLKSDHPAQI